MNTATSPTSGQFRAGAARPNAAPIRLTRRGRVVASVTATFAMLMVMSAIGAHGAAADVTTKAKTSVTVVVQPGQSLWQIAETAVPSQDPRETILQIKALNHMRTSSVLAGQTLEVPANQ